MFFPEEPFWTQTPELVYELEFFGLATSPDEQYLDV